MEQPVLPAIGIGGIRERFIVAINAVRLLLEVLGLADFVEMGLVMSLSSSFIIRFRESGSESITHGRRIGFLWFWVHWSTTRVSLSYSLGKWITNEYQIFLVLVGDIKC